jgi:plastocyanin
MDHRSPRLLRVVACLAVLGSVLLVGCSKSTKPSTEAAAATPSPPATVVNQGAVVKVTEYAFTQQSVTVKVGQAITWTNTGNVDHTVTETTPNPIDSPDIKPGQSYTLSFDKPGTYPYICSIHPDTMHGTIVVQASS